jgi:hypothetical protein
MFPFHGDIAGRHWMMDARHTVIRRNVPEKWRPQIENQQFLL